MGIVTVAVGWFVVRRVLRVLPKRPAASSRRRSSPRSSRCRHRPRCSCCSSTRSAERSSSPSARCWPPWSAGTSSSASVRRSSPRHRGRRDRRSSRPGVRRRGLQPALQLKGADGTLIDAPLGRHRPRRPARAVWESSSAGVVLTLLARRCGLLLRQLQPRRSGVRRRGPGVHRERQGPVFGSLRTSPTTATSVASRSASPGVIGVGAGARRSATGCSGSSRAGRSADADVPDHVREGLTRGRGPFRTSCTSTATRVVHRMPAQVKLVTWCVPARGRRDPAGGLLGLRRLRPAAGA